MSISRNDLEHTAALARLILEEEEIPGLLRDLAAVLGYAARLDALDLEGIDPAAASVQAQDAPLRADVVEPGLAPGEAVAPAPAAEEGLFRVPPALGGE